MRFSNCRDVKGAAISSSALYEMPNHGILKEDVSPYSSAANRPRISFVIELENLGATENMPVLT